MDRWDDAFWKSERSAAMERMRFARIMVEAIRKQVLAVYEGRRAAKAGGK